MHTCELEHIHVFAPRATMLACKSCGAQVLCAVRLSAAHASVPLINQPLQGSKGIYILLMLCTARDAQISLLYTLTRVHSCT